MSWITEVSTIGDSPVGVLIYVENVDAAFAQAVEEGRRDGGRDGRRLIFSG